MFIYSYRGGVGRIQDGGESKDLMYSSEGKMSFPCFHKTMCFSVIVYRTRSDGGFTKNRDGVCVNCPASVTANRRDPCPCSTIRSSVFGRL